MNVLRRLAPTKSAQSSTSSSEPTLVLHVPSYGGIYLRPPTVEAGGDTQAPPPDDHVLRGDLEISIPRKLGRVRCRTIRVGLRTLVKLNLGVGRQAEEDVLFQREVQIQGISDPSEVEGVVLEEGVQRFDFTLIVPSTMAPHDWHHNGKVWHEIYAVIEGIQSKAPSSSSSFRPFRSSSRGRSPVTTPGTRTPSSRSRSNSPFPHSGRTHEEPSPMYDLAQLDGALPQVPPYSYADSSANSSSALPQWLEGTYETKGSIMILYNPNPSGGVSELNEVASGFAPGLGLWNLQMTSESWSVCAVLNARLSLPALPSTATVFFFTINLTQTHTITSPRDSPETEPVDSTRIFVILEKGHRPPMTSSQAVGRGWPALWRGVNAGGKDKEGVEMRIEAKGRLPDDSLGRPSTLPGVITPIHVSHQLQVELYFSVFGETASGERFESPGDGGLRILRVQRSVIVPSCAFVAELTGLPSYTNSLNQDFNRPCPLCHTDVANSLCVTCPSDRMPHIRHDHDPNLVGNAAGTCPLCVQAFLPTGGPAGWQDCACGADIQKMQDRMRKAEEEAGASEGRGVDSMYNKEVEERGRR